jgi:hypothetical protein
MVTTLSGKLWEAVLIVKLKPEDRSLKQKIFLSSALAAVAFGYQALLRILSTVLLTRMLEPRVFGVFSVVISILYVVQMFSDLGVRSFDTDTEKTIDPTFLRCCWTVQILRGLVVGFVILVVAAAIEGPAGRRRLSGGEQLRRRGTAPRDRRDRPGVPHREL